MPGRYEVLEQIAEGGMGVVYRVFDRTLQVTRVMKLIRPQLDDLSRDEVRLRFQEEAKTAARLADHPNFVTLHTFDVDRSGTAYLVMELVDGVDLHRGLLASKVPNGNGLEPAFCVEVGVQALNALEYLHRLQLVHRDIAPDNLMITIDPTGRPLLKVIDLGIAKSLAADKRPLTAMGRPGPRKSPYASPEQLAGGQLDGRSDLYSLAVSLYELVTGHLPFTGDRRQIEHQHLLAEPRSFDETDPENRVPADLRRTILHALRKRPSDRPSTAADYARELGACAPDRLALATAATEALLGDETAHTTWTRPPADDPIQRQLDRVFPARLPGEAATPSGRPPSDPGRANATTRPIPSAPEKRRKVRSGRPRWLKAAAWVLAVAAIALALGLWVRNRTDAGPDGETRTVAEGAEDVSEGANPTEVEPQIDAPQDAPSPQPEGRAARAGGPPPAAATWAAGNRPGESRRNRRDGLEYVWIPPGEFRFGCSPGDDDCQEDERPAVQRNISRGFWIGRTEVTVRAYGSLDTTASLMPPAPASNPGWREESHPIVNLSRPEAARYCAAAATRLPTEVEWEYAARAGERRGAPMELEAVAWFGATSGGRTHAVAQRAANPFGLYDALGNAAEWVLPAAGRPAGEGVLRGGSWLHGREFMRFSFRLLDAPDRRDPMYGFRCLVEAAG